MTEVAAPVAGQEAPTAGVQPNAEGVKPEAQGGTSAEGKAEAKPEEGGAEAKPAEGEAKTGEEAEIVYEPKLPEGMAADQESLTKLVEIAKSNKWSPETVQQVVDLRAAQIKAQAESFAQEVQGWETSLKNDPTLGGAKLEETLAIGRRAMDLGPPELKAFLRETRLGSHPAVVKWMHAVGQKLTEGKHVVGGQGPGDTKTAAQILYPNQP